jgi:hypothetical protein
MASSDAETKTKIETAADQLFPNINQLMIAF